MNKKYTISLKETWDELSGTPVFLKKKTYFNFVKNVKYYQYSVCCTSKPHPSQWLTDFVFLFSATVDSDDSILQ